TRLLDALSVAVTPVVLVWALIFCTIVVAESVLAMLIGVPLIWSVPVLPPVGSPPMLVEPESTAGASGSSVAPLPRIVAGSSRGLEVKSVGLISSDPGMLGLALVVRGKVGRLA